MFKFIIIASAILASYFCTAQMGMEDMAVISAIGALYVSGQLIYTNMLPVGHGVDNSRHVLSMPAVTFFFYLLVLGFIVGLAFSVSGTVESKIDLGLRAFAVSAFLGWLAALLDWYLSSSKLTYFAQEGRTRSMLEMRGLSPHEIDKVIHAGYSLGMFGNPTEKRE